MNTGDFNANTCEGSYHFSVTFHDHFLIIRQLAHSLQNASAPAPAS